LQKRKVKLEWKSKGMMDDESGDGGMLSLASVESGGWE